MEILEPRMMLDTQYLFETNIYNQDFQQIDYVDVGQSFYLEITAEDLRANPLGLRGLGVKIQWDTTLIDVVEPFDLSEVLTLKFPLFRNGILGNGKIDWLQASAMLSVKVGDVIGDNGPERFALIPFIAKEEGIVDFNIRSRGGIGYYPSHIRGGVEFEQPTLQIGHNSNFVGPLPLEHYMLMKISAEVFANVDEETYQFYLDNPGDAFEALVAEESVEARVEKIELHNWANENCFNDEGFDL